MTQHNTYKVLLVDDEEQNLVSFRAAFRRNYEVYTARSAAEGLELLRHQKVPIIISDQRMPEVTGVEFLERAIPENPDSIRMILTGYSDIEAIIEAINEGQVFRYITKPWDEKDLKMAIDNAIAIHELNLKNKRLIVELNEKVQEQERTLNAFKKYVPEEVIQNILREGTTIKVHSGDAREVTVLFCDIRSFTPLSTELPAADVVLLLNQFYSTFTEVIKNYSGTVVQYNGDEIYAVFGAPVAFPEHRSSAVLCALEMMRKLPLLNEKFLNQFNQTIKIGIGVNSGEVVAGNMGSDDRMSYSVVGDTVNTAKRIESLTQDHPDTILLSESTYTPLQSFIETVAWPPVTVKGKSQPLNVFELLKWKSVEAV